MEDLPRGKQRNEKFQQSIDPELIRKKNESYAVELRRQKRMQHISKRRNLVLDQPFQTDPLAPELMNVIRFPFEILEYCPYLNNSALSDIEKLQYVREILESNPPFEVLVKTLELVRYILSQDKNSPIGTFVGLGYIETLLKFLCKDYPPNVVSETAWAVCNIASGPHEYANMLVQKGVMQALFSIVHPQSHRITEHAIWALANLAGDCDDYREKLVKMGFIGLLRRLQSELSEPCLEVERVLAWAYSNTARGSDYIPSEEILKIIEGVRKLFGSSDEEVLSECIWSLVHISKKENEKIQLVLNSGLYSNALRCLNVQSNSLVSPSVRLLGNICSGTHQQTQAMLSEGILDKLLALTSHEIPQLRKEVFWTISNIAAGTVDQCLFLLGHKIFEHIVEGLKDTDQEARKEVSYILSNLGKVLKNRQELLRTVNILQSLNFITQEPDPEIITNILDFCVQLLETSKFLSETQGIGTEVMNKFEEAGVITAIESLQSNLNPEVYNASIAVIEKYFGVEEETDYYNNYPQSSFRF